MEIRTLPGFRAMIRNPASDGLQPMFDSALGVFNTRAAKSGPDQFGRILAAQEVLQILPKSGPFGPQGDPEFAFLLVPREMNEVEKKIWDAEIAARQKAQEEAQAAQKAQAEAAMAGPVLVPEAE